MDNRSNSALRGVGMRPPMCYINCTGQTLQQEQHALQSLLISTSTAVASRLPELLTMSTILTSQSVTARAAHFTVLACQHINSFGKQAT